MAAITGWCTTGKLRVNLNCKKNPPDFGGFFDQHTANLALLGQCFNALFNGWVAAEQSHDATFA